MGWEEVAESLPGDLSPAGLEAYQFAFESPRIRMRQEFAAYALQSFTPGRPMAEALLDLTARIHADFRFDAGVTAMDADMAESYALDAIDFAQDAVDEAESAVLDAMYTRADAEALRT